MLFSFHLNIPLHTKSFFCALLSSSMCLLRCKNTLEEKGVLASPSHAVCSELVLSVCLYVPGHFLSVCLWFLVLAGLLFCVGFSGTDMLFAFQSLSDYYKLEVRKPR